jgi:hypothetical protein
MQFRVWDSTSRKFVGDPMTRNKALKLARSMGDTFQAVAVSK